MVHWSTTRRAMYYSCRLNTRDYFWPGTFLGSPRPVSKSRTLVERLKTIPIHCLSCFSDCKFNPLDVYFECLDDLPSLYQVIFHVFMQIPIIYQTATILNNRFLSITISNLHHSKCRTHSKNSFFYKKQRRKRSKLL